jgi:ribosome biogenesis GTPase
MKARVLKSTGSWYEVLTEEGQVVEARVRGKIRLLKYSETNPVAVGDEVELNDREGENVITEIHERRNHVLRQSVKKKGHAHVLAANIDQALVMVTLKKPRTSLGFIDRFLITAEAYRIPQIILVNKVDLLDADDQIALQELHRIYEPLSIPVVDACLLQETGLNPIQNLLAGKITLIAGHSGVGKSTLLNRLHPGIRQATRAISAYHEKGTHSTTYAEMFPLDANTFVIDTPGIKEWGLIDMEPQELSDYFMEMRALRSQCKFGARCLHLHEPGCAVLLAVAAGTISKSRYTNYCRMVSGEDSRK